MSKSAGGGGRLCNQIIRNLALSVIAEKNNLFVTYSHFDDINNKLGIKLFIGKNIFKETKKVQNRDYLKYYQSKSPIEYNLNFVYDYFQTREISNILYNHLHLNKMNIQSKNKYRNRYKNNNDIFLHIRLTDTSKWQPGINYFEKAINMINVKYNNIYIASDDFNSELVKNVKKKYPKIIFINKDPIETIKFGSTCKFIILSHGTFSAVIGYLAFYSNIYYPGFWHPKWCPEGLFLDKGFIPVKFDTKGMKF